MIRTPVVAVIEYLASLVLAAAVLYALGPINGGLKWLIAICVGGALAGAGTLLQYLSRRRSGESKQAALRSISQQWGVEEARAMVTDRGMAAWVIFVVLFGIYIASQASSLRLQIFTAAVLLASAIFGWSIRRRLGMRSLGPYGATFLVGFLMMVWLPIR